MVKKLNCLLKRPLSTLRWHQLFLLIQIPSTQSAAFTKDAFILFTTYLKASKSTLVYFRHSMAAFLTTINSNVGKLVYHLLQYKHCKTHSCSRPHNGGKHSVFVRPILLHYQKLSTDLAAKQRRLHTADQ